MNIFEITIQPKTDKGWPVAVKHTPSGHSPFYYKSTLDLNTQDNFAQLEQYLGQPEKYGIELGKKLFTPEIRLAFAKALSYSQGNNTQEQQKLYVFLHIDTFNDDSIKTLRWERLCAPFSPSDDDWECLSTDRRTTFSIYVPTMTERLFRVIGKNDLRALIVVANPSNSSKYGLADFDVHKTVESVQASLGDIPSDVLAKDINSAVGLPTLEQLKHHLSLPDKYYTLLHLVCHGKFVKGETIIYLANDQNQTEPVKTSVLIKELKDLPRAPHFTFLCTCESAKSGTEMGGLAQSLAQKLGMPAVLGMTDPVTIHTAQQLAAAFYQELRKHGYVSLALTEALVGLRRKRGDVTVPVLFSRLAGKPIYSQELDRELTSADIRVGIQRLQERERQLLKQRAPILIPEFEQQEKNLGNLKLDVRVLNEYDRNLRVDALKELNILCEQVLDVSFNALALTGEVTNYDSRCPFKGLKAFRKEDQEFFCGREALIEKLRQKLKEHNFLAVLGASGTGKSSVVLAGLIPVLEKQEKGIKIIEFTPDNHPLEKLQEKLSGVEEESLVVVVDQFEEVFTLCEKTNRDNFIAQLLKLAEYHKVIVTMRADFWGECAENEALKEVMLKNQELVSAMNDEELRKTIEEQAERVGLRFESGVVNLIQKDVESAPGEMPLLQYALEQLWQRRRGKWLLSEEYNKIGFKEAIARTADSFYGGLSEVEKEQVKNIFLRLTHLDESVVVDDQPKHTRQRIYLKDLITTDNSHVIEKLVQRLAGEEARLVVTRMESSGGGSEEITVEVAHEALITHWPKLQGWLDENRTNLQLRQSIRDASLDWRKHQDKSYLTHSGNRLAGAEALLQEKGFLNDSEVAYVNACVGKQRDEQERELRQARKARRAAQIISGISIVSTILVAGFGFFAWNQKLQAQQNLRKAELNKADFLVSYSHFLFNQGQELDAFVNTIKAGKLLQDGESKSELMESLAANLDRGSERNRLEGHDGTVSSVSFSPDGKTLASGSNDNTIKLWDVETGEEKLTLEGGGKSFTIVNFSPDGKTLAFAGNDSPIKLWNVNTGAEIRTLKGHDSTVHTVNSLSFSPDGQILASGSFDNTIKLWNVNTGVEIRTLKGHDNVVNSISFSPDGQILASGSKTIKLWDVKTGEEVRTLKHDDWVNSVSFSPNGQILASGSGDNTIKLWDVKTGEKIRTLKHDDWVNSVSFSPNGQILASGSDDNTIKLWDVEMGDQIRTIENDQPFNSVRFNPDGKTLASTSDEKTIKLWNVRTKEENRTFKGGERLGRDIGFNPDDKILAYSADDKTIKIWNVETKKEIHTFTLDSKSLFPIALSPDGRIFAYTGDDKTIKLRDVETGESRTLKGHEEEIYAIIFTCKGKILASASKDKIVKLWSMETGEEIHTIKDDNGVIMLSVSPDGKTLAFSTNEKTITLWSMETGEEIHTLKGHKDLIYHLSFSPDGKTLASGSWDTTIKLWNVENGEEIDTLKGHDKNILSLSFSPDGKMLASSSRDKTIKIWDVKTRQEKLTLKENHKGIYTLSFSPDSKILASMGGDNTIKLWTEELRPDFNTLMKENCDWVRNYLKYNPKVEDEDKKLCDDIPSAKERVE